MAQTPSQCDLKKNYQTARTVISGIECVAPTGMLLMDSGSHEERSVHRVVVRRGSAGRQLGAYGGGASGSFGLSARRSAVAALGICCTGLLCLSMLARHDATALEDIVSPPVMGTGGGSTTPEKDHVPVVSPAVMGAPGIDGPPWSRHHGSTWHRYSVDYNVWGLHVHDGGRLDADAPTGLPAAGRNEWKSPFSDFDFEPSHRHDSAGEQAAAIFSGVRHRGEILFNGYHRRPVAPEQSGEGRMQSGGVRGRAGTTLGGGAGTRGSTSAAAQANAIVNDASAEQAANTAAATVAESEAHAPSTASDNARTAHASDGGGGAGDKDEGGGNGPGDGRGQGSDSGSGGNEKGGAPPTKPPKDGENGGLSSGTAGSSSERDSVGVVGAGTAGGRDDLPPVTGNNCFLLPSLCPQYSPPFPGIKGAGANTKHVSGEPEEERESQPTSAGDTAQQKGDTDSTAQQMGGSASMQRNANDLAGNILGDDQLGPVGKASPSDPQPPTPAPYTPNIVVDTSQDNGAAGMGEGINIDTGVDASFVGGSPVEEKGRSTDLFQVTRSVDSLAPRLPSSSIMDKRNGFLQDASTWSGSKIKPMNLDTGVAAQFFNFIPTGWRVLPDPHPSGGVRGNSMLQDVALIERQRIAAS